MVSWNYFGRKTKTKQRNEKRSIVAVFGVSTDNCV